MSFQWIGWSDPIFRMTTYILMGFLIALAAIIFPIRKKNYYTKSFWWSTTSWITITPVLCLSLALGDSWPLIFFGVAAIFACKEFFQITGMYTQTLFLWTSYVAIVFSAVSIHQGWNLVYDILPMLFLALIAHIPILKNEFKGMLQVSALSLIAFMFFGWAYLHLARVSQLEFGARYLIYIMILTEFSDNLVMIWSRLFGKIYLIDRIAPKRSLDGFFIALLATVFLAWLLRFMLPDTHWSYWLSAGLTASFVGGLGDIFLGVLRRDLGVKDTGAFIIGRGGVIDRMDRLIFVSPIYYYVLETILRLKN